MINYNFKQLVKKGVHLGHYQWDTDYKISFYLLGLRNNLHIININYTIYILKRVLHIIWNISKFNQKILLINNNGCNTILDNYVKFYKRFLYVNNKWKGGLLTNHKNIRKYNFDLLNNYQSLQYMYILPAIVFASNFKETNSSLYESIILNIPTSGLLNSNTNLYGLHYGIPSNDNSLYTKNFFNLLLLKCSIESLNNNIISIYKKVKINKLKKVKYRKWRKKQKK